MESEFLAALAFRIMDSLVVVDELATTEGTKGKGIGF